MSEDIEKTEILDSEVKGTLSEFLDVALELKHFVIDQIRREQENIKIFERNKDEYIQTIADFKNLEEESYQEEIRILKEKMQQQSEKLKGIQNE